MRRALAAPLPLLVLATACATPQAPPLRPLPDGDARPAALLAALERDAAGRRALRGTAKLSLEGPGGSASGRQVIVVERPARLRVEVLGFLNQTLAVLTTDGARYRLFQAQDRSLTEGPVHDGLLWEVAGIALSPEDAVRVLLGAPRPPEGARVTGGASLPEGGIQVELERNAVRLQLEFDRAERLRRWTVLDASARTLWEARYGDYRAVGGDHIAHTIEVDDRVNGTQARVSLGELELNPELPAGIFRLEPGGLG